VSDRVNLWIKIRARLKQRYAKQFSNNKYQDGTTKSSS
jgi:hypothetical protein